MKWFHYVSLAAIAAACLCVQSASAISVDDKSMNGSADSARFSDPDEKTPAQAVAIAPNHLQGDKESSFGGGEEPSTVRYDYDKDSGNYIPHRQ